MAIIGYRQILAQDKDNAVAIQLIGMALNQLGHVSEALPYLQRAVKIAPQSEGVSLQLGDAYEQLGQLEDAASVYRELLKQSPNHAAANNNLAGVLQRTGQLDEAIEHYQQAVKLNPNYLIGWKNYAVAADAAGKTEWAAEAYKQWLWLEPGNVTAAMRHGAILQQMGQADEAISVFASVMQDEPNHFGAAVRHATTVPVVYESHDQIDRSRRHVEESLDELLAADVTSEDPLTEVGSTLFHLVYQGRNDLDIQQKMARIYQQSCPPLNFTAGHCMDWQPPAERIRLGIASKYLRNHTIGMFMLNVVEHLSRERFDLTVIRPTDQQDDIARRIDAAAENTVPLPTDLKEAQQNIADLKLDILLYPDIGMEPLTYLLCFARLAPVQCVWWGHPVTTGIPNADYYLSCGRMEPPGAETHYSENLVRLSTQACYPQRPPRAAQRLPRSHWGLPDDTHLYVCGQSLFKIHPDFDGLLEGILQQDGKAQIILFEQRQPLWHQTLQKRFAKTLGENADRVAFLPRQTFPEFLQLMEQADVVLDPPHFTGGNTTYQAIGLGSPIVTLPGEFMRSRITFGAYDQIGVTDCIAIDEQDYVSKAVSIANNADLRHELSAKLLSSSDVLFENLDAVKELEAFFEEMASG